MPAVDHLVSGEMTGRGTGRSSRWLVLAGLLLVVLLVILAGGCKVNTDIDVDTTPTGTGTVGVTVTLDKAATEAIGDIQSELQTSDLTRAGWQVSGPVAVAGGSTVIRATHSFASLEDASTLVAQVAGTGPAGSRPFQLDVRHEKTFWTTSNHLVGRVDLRCGLTCFGDSGLRHDLGVATGVDPGSPASQQRDFTFGMTVTLPGTLRATNAQSVAGHRLTWRPRLGQETVLSAMTKDRIDAHVYGVIAAAGAVALAIIAGVVALLWRRRSQRRSRDYWGWG